MALTQEQYYEKIKGLIPKWFFESPDHQEAVIQGLAKMWAQIHQDAEDHRDETFITRSNSEFLDAHGDERAVTRIDDEYDAQYSVRVQNLRNMSNLPELKKLVDALLMVGESTFIEDNDAGVFCDREYFINRGALLIDPRIMNTFTILVDKQIHPPYSFLDREYFCDREDFIGIADSSQLVFDLILETVKTNKAQSTKFRIIERLET